MRPGTILVIGYGNDLRGDDGAGQRAAAQVEAWGLPGVHARALHQLTPELAEPLAAADRAIFLDAHPVSDGATIRIRRIDPAASPARFAHIADPRALLDLTRTAFGRAPEGWSVTIPARDFAFGAALSPLTARGVADALIAIRPLLELPLRADDARHGPEDDGAATGAAGPRLDTESFVINGT